MNSAAFKAILIVTTIGVMSALPPMNAARALDTTGDVRVYTEVTEKIPLKAKVVKRL